MRRQEGRVAFAVLAHPSEQQAAWGPTMTVIYQPVLVSLSIAVAILGSLTALALTSHSHEDSGQRSFALANGGLIMGATIWSMHFVAMMAVEFPLVVNYNLVETIISICIAIVATGTGLNIASSRRFGMASIPLGGVLMGLGIGGMHYLGMSAIRGCGLAYDLRLVAASVVIAISRLDCRPMVCLLQAQFAHDARRRGGARVLPSPRCTTLRWRRRTLCP